MPVALTSLTPVAELLDSYNAAGEYRMRSDIACREHSNEKSGKWLKNYCTTVNIIDR
jgi:hypothetical protein